MPWIKETCQEALCGLLVGIGKGAFGVSLFTESETEEINNYKKLALSVLEKAPEIVTDDVICEGIRNTQKSALETFAKNTPTEAVAAGLVTTAELICSKAFKTRFKDVLMGACLNLVGC